MTVIDLSAQLDDIRARYPDWWHSDDATRELQALWGNPACNDCGVFTDCERITIALPGHAQWNGAVKLAAAPNFWHAFATSYAYPLGGGGYAISVWNRTAYTTRDEALRAGIDELIREFEGVRDAAGYKPASQAADASRMIEQLR
ncbi:MAG: hypothetical protein ACRD9W_13775, partial [Terriglobia bacterium]